MIHFFNCHTVLFYLWYEVACLLLFLILKNVHVLCACHFHFSAHMTMSSCIVSKLTECTINTMTKHEKCFY